MQIVRKGIEQIVDVEDAGLMARGINARRRQRCVRVHVRVFVWQIIGILHIVCGIFAFSIFHIASYI